MKIPGLEENQLPSDRRRAIQSALLSTIATEKKQKSRKKRTILVGGAVSIALAGTAGGVYISSQQVHDQQAIRCYYSTNIDEQNGATLGTVSAEDSKRTTALERCGELWRKGILTTSGLNPGLRQPTPTFDPNDEDANYYVPPLVACVIKDAVAVLPGGPDTCRSLGLPELSP